MRILSLAPLAGPGLESLRTLGELELEAWNASNPPRIHSAAELIPKLDGVGALLVEADHISREVLESSDDLRVVGACRGDPVNIDIAAATKRGIPVLNAPGRNADAVAELTVAFIFSVTRSLVAADDDVRAGRYLVDGTIPQQRYFAREIANMTVGLVGCGAVGRATGRRLVALGARVVGFDPYLAPEVLRDVGIEPVDLAGLLKIADVISIHAMLTDETRGMMGRKELSAAKPGAYLVNSARFDIVDMDALLESLRSGRLGGAAFDHFPGEFLPPDHPLASMPNVILTPHIGGATAETVVHHTAAMADGLGALLSGAEPPNVVNPEVLPTFFGR
jgi:D-3-phosphoglycerate dehydrogenase / 2-oxoglutarate reductase